MYKECFVALTLNFYASAGISRHHVSICLSVRQSVTSWHCSKTAKHRLTQTTPGDSPGTLVFCFQQSLVGDLPYLQTFALKVTHPSPFQTAQFWPIFVHSTSTVRASEKVQLALIGSQPRAFHRAIDEPCTLPLSPQRVAQNAILLFCQ